LVAANFFSSPGSGPLTSGMIQKNHSTKVNFASRAVIQLTLTPPDILCSLGSAVQYRLWFVLKRESFGSRGGFHV